MKIDEQWECWTVYLVRNKNWRHVPGGRKGRHVWPRLVQKIAEGKASCELSWEVKGISSGRRLLPDLSEITRVRTAAMEVCLVSWTVNASRVSQNFLEFLKIPKQVGVMVDVYLVLRSISYLLWRRFFIYQVQALCEKDKKSESSTERLLDLIHTCFFLFFFTTLRIQYLAHTYLVHRTQSNYRRQHTMTDHGTW